MSLFFLMCSERSGSNFIAKLLNGHKNICGPSTKHIINPLARNLFRYGDLHKEDNWNELLLDVHRLFCVEFSVWKIGLSLEDLQDLAAPGDIKSLIQNIFMEEARANGKQHVFIKENHIYEFLPFLMAYFPESKFVYQTRDPRDMALSWKKSIDHPGGVVKAARQWKHDQQQSMKNFQLMESQGKAHFLKYENLTANNEMEIRKLIRFLGVPFDDGVFEFYKDELTQRNAGMQGTWSNLSKGVISNNSKKYSKELTEYEIKAIEKICFYEMKHLEYKSDFSFEELSEITDESLEEFNRKEFSEIELRRSRGVVNNMAAKAKFYQR